MDSLRDDMNGIRKKIQNERDFFDSKMKNFENADKINNYIITSIKKSQQEIENKFDKEIDIINKDLDKVWRENLILPGFIGRGSKCKYPNVKAYIEFLQENTEKVDQLIATNSDRCEDNTQILRTKAIKIREDVIEKLNKERHYYTFKMQELRDDFASHQSEIEDKKTTLVKQFEKVKLKLETIKPD